jgi:hypothetical protein
VVDEYIDMILSYPDVKAATSLTGPEGPCRYVSKDSIVELLRQYFSTGVSLTIKKVYGDDVTLRLAPALIWGRAIFDTTDSTLIIIPASLRAHIKNSLQGVDANTNPVENMSLLVTNNGDKLQIVPLIGPDSVPGLAPRRQVSGGAILRATRVGDEEIQGLYSLIYQQ